ncbi:MAG: 30S ribosomal protein S2 [Candidatus Aenigmarchaeota archaeon]|nr:30S ribosomal protein S2 [Candidatus Aenigmarchaeota archaeon]
MAIPSMREMLEAGVHFGHKASRWNPKMAPFIFTQRDKIHIFDLAQTVEMLEKACNFLEKIAKEGKTILFVGTKKQASSIIKREAERCGMPYISERWLGGMLTNFKTIRARIKYFKELESRDLENLTKKEKARLLTEKNKLRQIFEGIKDLNDLPDALFVVDIIREETAVREANRLKIPVVALVDSNNSPNLVDYIIPGNDDAIGSIKIIAQSVTNAIIEGGGGKAKKIEEVKQESEEKKIVSKPIKETKEKVKKVSKVAEATEVSKIENKKEAKKTEIKEKKIRNRKNLKRLKKNQK